MFGKNEREYRLAAINNCFWLLLIILLSIVSILRKLLKTYHTEEHRFLSNSESCNIWLGSLKNQFNSKQSFQIFFIYSLYFIIFFPFNDLRVTYENMHSCFEDFFNGQHFSYFPGMCQSWKQVVSEILILRNTIKNKKYQLYTSALKNNQWL